MNSLLSNEQAQSHSTSELLIYGANQSDSDYDSDNDEYYIGGNYYQEKHYEIGERIGSTEFEDIYFDVCSCCKLPKRVIKFSKPYYDIDNAMNYCDKCDSKFRIDNGKRCQWDKVYFFQWENKLQHIHKELNE